MWTNAVTPLIGETCDRRVQSAGDMCLDCVYLLSIKEWPRCNWDRKPIVSDCGMVICEKYQPMLVSTKWEQRSKELAKHEGGDIACLTRSSNTSRHQSGPRTKKKFPPA